MRFLLPVLLAFVLLSGCDSGDPASPASTALLPDDALYAWSFMSRIIETDSLLFRDTAEVRVRTVSRDATVPGYEGLVELEATSPPREARLWYESTTERLRQVAAVVPVSTPPAYPRVAEGALDVYSFPRIVADLVAQHRPARSGSDSLIVREDPRVVYELPLEVGAAWVSFTEPFGSTREVIGRETITVEAGTFDCFVIRTEIDIDERYEGLDYVSEEHGIVLRRAEWIGEHRGPDNLPSGQFFRTVERLELTAGG
jgi:hypothetical protein